MNIFLFEYSNILIYYNIFILKIKKKSMNECLNRFVALKLDEYFDKWIYSPINIQISKYLPHTEMNAVQNQGIGQHGLGPTFRSLAVYVVEVVKPGHPSGLK